MIEIDNLSKIGFGSYRVSMDCRDHEIALKQALDLGCNLIDTSSNYTNGNSEKLIGKVIKEHDVFVITKAGYISNDNLDLYNKQISKGITFTDTVNIRPDFKHSISPDYLKHQLSVSFDRMGVDTIDCFLLHNPEYYFKSSDSNHSLKEYYNRIYKAFEFLEDQVRKGRIRYYGISSNTFALQNKYNSTDLKEILPIAQKVSSSNHFKFIQFPFNIIENHALEKQYLNDKNLVEFAQTHGVKCISNRPLTANSENDNFKLISIDSNFDADEIKNKISSFLNDVQQILDDKGYEENIEDIKVLNALHSNWKNITDKIFLRKFIEQYILPVLVQITESDIPQFLALKLDNIHDVLNERINYLQAYKTRDYLLDRFGIDTLNIKNVPSYIIEKYLNSGIDHVLVGMRNVAYVYQLKSLIQQ